MKRSATAVWQGDLKAGKGAITTASTTLNSAQYSFSTRFENGVGTNPEELLGAAHAACFSMALSAALEKGGHPVTRVHTTAAVRLDKVGDAFGITKIDLTTEAEVPGIDDGAFQQAAAGAKANCPV